MARPERSGGESGPSARARAFPIPVLPVASDESPGHSQVPWPRGAIRACASGRALSRIRFLLRAPDRALRYTTSLVSSKCHPKRVRFQLLSGIAETPFEARADFSPAAVSGVAASRTGRRSPFSRRACALARWAGVVGCRRLVMREVNLTGGSAGGVTAAMDAGPGRAVSRDELL
jgi:hypothetical protein